MKMDELAICSYCGEMCNPMHHECGPVGFNEPQYQWEIEIGGQMGIVCKMQSPPPSRFQRFVYRTLLGWKVNIL
jgi:hypothetical protein